MKIYVYEYVAVVSDAYHSDGGVVIITNRDPGEVWAEQGKPGPEPWNLGFTPSALPDADVVGTAPGPERVIILPNVGCC